PLSRQCDEGQPDAGVHGEIVDTLPALCDDRVTIQLLGELARLAADLLQVLIDGHGSDRDRRAAQAPARGGGWQAGWPGHGPGGRGRAGDGSDRYRAGPGMPPHRGAPRSTDLWKCQVEMDQLRCGLIWPHLIARSFSSRHW